MPPVTISSNSARSKGAARSFFQPLQLLQMMPPMHPMKFPPLRRPKRTKDGMIDQRNFAAEFLFRFRNHGVHGDDLLGKFSKHAIAGNPPRLGILGGLPALR